MVQHRKYSKYFTTINGVWDFPGWSDCKESA